MKEAGDVIIRVDIPSDDTVIVNGQPFSSQTFLDHKDEVLNQAQERREKDHAEGDQKRIMDAVLFENEELKRLLLEKEKRLKEAFDKFGSDYKPGDLDIIGNT